MNKLTTSYEHMIPLLGTSAFLSSSTNSKLSLTHLELKSSTTGSNNRANHLEMSYAADPNIEIIGLSGTSFLCILGKPYALGRDEPVGLSS